MLDTNATKVSSKAIRPVGVQIVTGDSLRNVRATREVILSAGAIHSARVLMLSASAIPRSSEG